MKKGGAKQLIRFTEMDERRWTLVTNLLEREDMAPR